MRGGDPIVIFDRKTEGREARQGKAIFQPYRVIYPGLRPDRWPVLSLILICYSARAEGPSIPYGARAAAETIAEKALFFSC
jgi:hypothetical protein